MPLIELSTFVSAPRTRVFDLARSIDAHQDSTTGTHERAIAGVTQGLIGLNDEVTWQAKHFGVTQTLSVRITAFDRPNHFQDVMIAGAFKRMQHDHLFSDHLDGTLMQDRFEFAAPLGILGRIAEGAFLTYYRRRFLVQRNAILRQLAESENWKRYLRG